jgi:hypothetical protein
MEFGKCNEDAIEQKVGVVGFFIKKRNNETVCLYCIDSQELSEIPAENLDLLFYDHYEPIACDRCGVPIETARLDEIMESGAYSDESFGEGFENKVQRIRVKRKEGREQFKEGREQFEEARYDKAVEQAEKDGYQ